MNNNNENNYMYMTSLDTTDNKEDFIIELYDLSEGQNEPSTAPVKVIHTFEELILFLEEPDGVEHGDSVNTTEPVVV